VRVGLGIPIGRQMHNVMGSIRRVDMIHVGMVDGLVLVHGLVMDFGVIDGYVIACVVVLRLGLAETVVVLVWGSGDQDGGGGNHLYCFDLQ